MLTIALRAANGRYVCAENGGDAVGLVHANREAIGPWETWKVHHLEPDDHGDPRVALETMSGRFLCAEGGGGGDVRANRLAIGPWERFSVKGFGLRELGLLSLRRMPLGIGFGTDDGVHYLCAEIGSPDVFLSATRTVQGSWETFDLEIIESDRPSPAQVRMIRANFCGSRDRMGRIVFDPYYIALSDLERTEWREQKHDAGLTHVVLCPVADYPSYPVASRDLRRMPTVFAEYVVELIDDSLIPIIFLTTGDRGTATDIMTVWPALFDALNSVAQFVWFVPGFEVVGPGGGWTSAELARGLTTIHDRLPAARIAVHFQPERASGASHPIEINDPWQGNEVGFWHMHGGQYVDALFYQTPHGAKLLSGFQWEDRWIEILDRLGLGQRGWRRTDLCLFETAAYDYYHRRASDADIARLSTRAQALAEARGVTISFGNGLPTVQIQTDSE